MSIPLERLDAFLLIAQKAASSPDAKIAASANSMFEDAFKIAKSHKGEIAVSADVLLQISNAQIEAKQNARALTTLQYLRPRLMKSEFEGQIDRPPAWRAISFWLETTIRRWVSSDPSVILQIGRRRCHRLPTPSVRKVISTRLSRCSALLFRALIALAPANDGSKSSATSYIDKSKLGRSADAFKMAGFVRDRRLQALTMLAMGKAMLEVDDLKNVETVTNYIPYIGMRSQIFHRTCQRKRDRRQKYGSQRASRQGFSGPTKCSCQEDQSGKPRARPYAKRRNSTPRWRAGSSSLAVRSHTSIIEKSADHEAARRGSIEDGGDLGEKWQETKWRKTTSM